MIGRDVVLYWRALDAGQTAEVPLTSWPRCRDLHGPGRRAYLYYTDEFKQWAPGVGVTITKRTGSKD